MRGGTTKPQSPSSTAALGTASNHEHDRVSSCLGNIRASPPPSVLRLTALSSNQRERPYGGENGREKGASRLIRDDSLIRHTQDGAHTGGGVRRRLSEKMIAFIAALAESRQHPVQHIAMVLHCWSERGSLMMQTDADVACVGEFDLHLMSRAEIGERDEQH